MGNNIACKVDGIGKVTLKFENAYIYIFERVRYVLELNRKLISMKNLDDMGLLGKIGNGLLKVIKGYLNIFKRVKRNGIYVVMANIIGNYIAESSSAELNATLKCTKN